MRKRTTQILLLGIKAYQRIGKLLQFRSPCRFYPSCSAYAEQAIQVCGIARGIYLAAGRLIRCHPWNPGGVDLLKEWENR